MGGDHEAARLTLEAGRIIGRVVATMACLLNPEVLLLGGALASSPLLAGVRESLHGSPLPRATRHLTLRLPMLGQDASIVGLTRMLVDREFAPHGVNARLA